MHTHVRRSRYAHTNTCTYEHMYIQKHVVLHTKTCTLHSNMCTQTDDTELVLTRVKIKRVEDAKVSEILSDDCKTSRPINYAEPSTTHFRSKRQPSDVHYRKHHPHLSSLNPLFLPFLFLSIPSPPLTLPSINLSTLSFPSCVFLLHSSACHFCSSSNAFFLRSNSNSSHSCSLFSHSSSASSSCHISSHSFSVLPPPSPSLSPSPSSPPPPLPQSLHHRLPIEQRIESSRGF